MMNTAERWEDAMEFIRYVVAHLEYTEPEVFSEGSVAIDELRKIFEQQQEIINRERIHTVPGSQTNA